MPGLHINMGDFQEQIKETILQVLKAKKDRARYPLIIEQEIPPVDIISWLFRQPGEHRVYWQDKAGTIEAAGIGTGFQTASDSLTDIYNVSLIKPLFFYNKLFNLSDNNSNLWGAFPSELCMLPQRMIIRRHDSYRYRLCIEFSGNDKIEDIVRKFERLQIDSSQITPSETDTLSLQPIRHMPEYENWTMNVERCLEAIHSKKLAKVVMARQSDYSFNEDITAESCLKALLKAGKITYIMLYQPDNQNTFISLTPERLFHRFEKEIYIDAISSTTRRGQTESEDKSLADELISDSKQSLEHKFVIDGIFDSLKELCSGKPTVHATEILKLPMVQHLKTLIDGGLMTTDDQAIINKLHPTPAVGGTPTLAAVKWIKSAEPFSRGLYAAPMGLISEEETEIAVGIRSMLLKGKTISVFTGAGIVEGSDPDLEWREINSKNILSKFIQEEKN
ncbi:MAG: isochorismate synthase [candidate division Zixibacteria bacterium]|nr:isochorismate synthase [candidate division Zixibacteria bacterium]